MHNLANAVNYYFDGDEVFKLVMVFVKIETSIAVNDEKVQLTNLLREIERRALIYLKKSGVPVIIMIDDADSLREQMPGALELLQNKGEALGRLEHGTRRLRRERRRDGDGPTEELEHLVASRRLGLRRRSQQRRSNKIPQSASHNCCKWKERRRGRHK